MTVRSSDNQDEHYKDAKSSYFNLPALDVSEAFPQATPASVFPPCTSDYYQLDDLLTPEEQGLRMKVRECMEKEIAPIMAKYWEKAEFPFHVVPKLGALGIAGGTIKGYGCPGVSITANAICAAEIARVDASCSTFILVHSSLGMLTISIGGSEAQKQKYLPSLAQLKTIACWGLTEPDYGSDASSLKTTATKVDGGWILEGQKRWIGNSTFADVLVIFARNTTTNQINAFLVMKDAPGLQATKIENKIGLRIVQNGDIVLKRVFVPDEDRLPGINSFQDTNKDGARMKADKEVWKGLVDCIERLVPTERMQDEILHQIALYEEEEGIFKKDMAIRQRITRSPVEWWKSFGRETPELQKFAIKILSLTCSSSGCERNWSVFEHLHTKKRNKLDQKRLNDLVFVKYNRALRRRYMKRGKFDPISLKNIDESNEWLIGKLEDELVFDGEDLDWNVVAEASGVEQPSKVTRSTHKSTSSKKRSKASTSCLDDWEEEELDDTVSDEGEEEDVDGYQSNDDEEDEDIGDD